MYQVWSMMRYRCNTPTCKAYPKYGGRGIKISSEWDTFEGFYEWAIHNGYEENLTLDRKDNDGNYEPDNCQWITLEEQQKNRSYNYDIVINGESKTLYEWCEIYDLNYNTFMTRVNAYEWDVIKALTTPVTYRKKPTGFNTVLDENKSKVKRNKSK